MLRKLLSESLVKLANGLLSFSKKIYRKEENEPNLMELGRKAHDERIEEIPTESRFGDLSFDEALVNSDFVIRHGVANKLISSFTYEKEEISQDLLKKCARVALERVTHALEDENKLISIWMDQHNAADFEIYTRLEDEELAFTRELEKKMMYKN